MWMKIEQSSVQQKSSVYFFEIISGHPYNKHYNNMHYDVP